MFIVKYAGISQVYKKQNTFLALNKALPGYKKAFPFNRIGRPLIL